MAYSWLPNELRRPTVQDVCGLGEKLGSEPKKQMKRNRIQTAKNELFSIFDIVIGGVSATYLFECNRALQVPFALHPQVISSTIFAARSI